ncbi:uncharacterized protein LOC125000541 isoform X4 [Mugil cephalus]|uniref:uncharacterized protein LOC125000541 isoform X4 n=1 Tax=Mugil cephalus TaxID=48193 RepID=UPI001FB68459|nr:uncharacterized protein LOC125000541 isoform X4 [Mugil cephalus]
MPRWKSVGHHRDQRIKDRVLTSAHILPSTLLGGVVSFSHGWISVPTLEVTVRPGDNITLYCDCRPSRGEHIVWFRNCSHEYQPTLVLDSTGLYYCATEKTKVEDKEYNTRRHIYTYGNITTKIILDSRDPRPHTTPSDCSMCWMLLYSLCPVCAGVSSFLSSLLVYHFCRKRAKDHQVDEQNADTGQTRLNQGEDVCYAALEIRQPSQRPKNKRQSSDFSTYSAVNTSRM